MVGQWLICLDIGGGENMSNMSTPKMNFFASVVSQLSNVF